MTEKNKWHIFVVKIHPLSKNRLNDYKLWCEENISKYKISLLLSGPSEVVIPAGYARIQIKNDEDALAFKLKWL